MQIDYDKLATIAADPESRSLLAKDSSDVLSSYMQLLSNLIYAHERLSESEIAMITASINKWITKKDICISKKYGVGKIVQIEWGNNFSPELSYKHPAIIIEEWGNSVLVVPTTSTPSKVEEAYHPIDNPKGKWYYRKVGVSEGFAHDCAIILDNAKILSKSRIISISGSISGNINDKSNVFREIRQTMIKHFFSKEWIEHSKLEQAYEASCKENIELKEKYNLLLDEYNKLKNANTGNN